MWERFRRQFEPKYTPAEVEVTQEDKCCISERIRALIAVDMQQLLGRKYDLDFVLQEIGDPSLANLKTSVKATAILDLGSETEFYFTPGYDVLLRERQHELAVIKAAHRRVLKHFNLKFWKVCAGDSFTHYTGQPVKMVEKNGGALYVTPGKKPIEYHLQWQFEKK